MEEPKRFFLSLTQASDLLGISAKEIKTYLDNGEIEAWKTESGYWRIPIANLEAWGFDIAKRNTQERRAANEKA